MITQNELSVIIYRLECCSAEKANELVTCLTNGDKKYKIKLNNLMYLIEGIKLLLKYNTSDINKNCLSEDDFNKILDNTTNICKLCNCN